MTRWRSRAPISATTARQNVSNVVFFLFFAQLSAYPVFRGVEYRREIDRSEIVAYIEMLCEWWRVFNIFIRDNYRTSVRKKNEMQKWQARKLKLC
uniref:Secreted protein n=1 Tax=Trichogramma kaykai TaxID=54128 RepID=A0ABD2WG15_9HYME